MVKKRVAVAMSGGVDSSVTAYLLQKKGYECIGLTMCFGLAVGAADRRKPQCCGPEGIRDARSVAVHLGIKHYVVNLGNQLQRKVVDKFCAEYLAGRTPNPCIDCNRFIKFGLLLNKARQLGAEYLATGHYARVIFDKRRKQYLLKKGKDKSKDQSYFLYHIASEDLQSILMPLGGLPKERVRQIARAAHLPVAEKPDSQEICFLPSDDYRGFLRERMAQQPSEGPIVDVRGNVLGRHKGVAFYTVGQRDGLGIAYKERLYVTHIDPKANTIVVGTRSEADSRGCIANNAHFLLPLGAKQRLVLDCKIRYNHPHISATVTREGRGRLRVEFANPQFAVAPGQAVVFYSRDTVVGGATIESRL